MAAFESFGTAVESQISAFAESVSGSLIGTLGPVIALCLAVWFTAKAWGILFRGASGSVADLVLSCARAGFVAYFALSAPHYAGLAIPAVTGVESWLTSALPKSPANAWAAIDLLWEAAAEGIAALWGLVGTYGVTEIGQELLLALSVVAMTVLGVLLTSAALGVILLAKIALSLTLGFGPLFLCALMFPQARGWFDPWLRSTLTWLFAIVMAGAVLLFFSDLFEARTSRIAEAAASSDPDTFGIWLELGITLVITLTASSIVRMIPSIAAGLAGGCSMQAAGLASMAAGPALVARGLAGGALLGWGTASGSDSAAKLGHRILGRRGLDASGAMAGGAAGAAAGLSAAAARRVARAAGAAGAASASPSPGRSPEER